MSLSNPTPMSYKTPIYSHLHSNLMAAELSIRVGNLFSPGRIWTLSDHWIIIILDYLISLKQSTLNYSLSLATPTEHCRTDTWYCILGREEEGFSFPLVAEITFQISVLIRVIA